MLQYYTVASLLKMFSLSDQTRQAYRYLGNLRNAVKPETDIATKYYFRSPRFLDMLRRHQVLTPGLNALEVGTGFVHWEAMLLRNEIECTATLYDVWDNRTFNRFQAYVERLADPSVRARLGLGSEAGDAGLALMREIADCTSFDQAYAKLGFKYVLDPPGLLAGLEDGAYDLVISSDVGEHLNRDDIPTIIGRTMDVLKPGGWAYHQIVLVDHLCIYAKSAHPKQYLKYTKSHFSRFVNNGVQYINQVQIPEWNQMFTDAGFEIAALERIGSCDLSKIDVHGDWSHMSDEDLACTVVQYLLRKPE